MRIIDLLESPMEWGGYHDLSTGSGEKTIPDVDHSLVQSPKYVEKIKRVWRTSVVDVVAFVVRLDIAKFGSSIDGNLEKSSYEGLISSLNPDFKPGHKPKDAIYTMEEVAYELGIDPVPGKITTIYYKNPKSGDGFNMPLTPWMFAHRLAHAMISVAPAEFSSIEKIILDLGEIGSPAAIMGLSKMMRNESSVETITELPYEVMAKYILTGSLMFRPHGKMRNLRSGFWSAVRTDPNFHGMRTMNAVEKRMEALCQSAIDQCKGSLLVV